ncbi:MAG: hypothetical protein AB1779_07865 [Candidatus Thermoplasmatota archaeon]
MPSPHEEVVKPEEKEVLITAEFVEKARAEVKELEKELGTYLLDAEKNLRDADGALKKMDYLNAKKHAEEALAFVKKVREEKGQKG